MANSSRINRGNIPRALQYGLDLIIDQEGKNYKGVGDEIFKVVMTDKGYYEMMQLAGMGVAGRKNEGSPITYDSIDQSWVFRIPVHCYEKSARITREMVKDNVYENLLPRIAREQLKSLAHARDLQMANVLNNAFATVTYGDTKVLCASDHGVQAGGTNSNLLAVAADFSIDSMEAMQSLIDSFVNDDGLLGDYNPSALIIPPALRFEAHRVLKSVNEPGSANNDVNAVRVEGMVSKVFVWKRLTDSDAFFITTDAENGLMMVKREGIFTQSSQDPFTFDTILSAAERYAVSVGDHRCIVGTPGA